VIARIIAYHAYAEATKLRSVIHAAEDVAATYVTIRRIDGSLHVPLTRNAVPDERRRFAGGSSA
jgi:hypothetical protein